MLKQLIKKLQFLRLFYVLFKRNKNDFHKNLMQDWGKTDVYGPWTKEKNNGKLYFYKSYYMITDNKQPTSLY
jgi:hypothetical protein